MNKQFARFFLVGIVSTLTTYLVLFFLVEKFETNAVLASAIGYVVAVSVNYGMNYRFTFRSSQRHLVAAPKFTLVMIVGFILNTGLMYVGTVWLGFHYAFAQLCAVAVVLFWSFLANRTWTFAS